MSAPDADLSFRDSEPTDVDPAAIWWSGEHLHHTEPSPAFRQWIAVARKPRVATAVALAILATFTIVLAPVCWAAAGDELKAIDRGEAEPHGRGWIVLAHSWGILITVFAFTLLALLAVVSAVR